LKTVGLLVRPDFTAGLQVAREIIKHLEGRNIRILLPPHLATALKRSELGSPLKDFQADFVISLGGDGTTLYAARHLPPTIPILPVNLESFGFLSECEAHEVEERLNQALQGELVVQETPRLGLWLGKKQLAVVANEAAFFPNEKGRPATIKVYLESHNEFEFRADGFVIATPMGSTGHALSLGGPILDPQLHALLLIAAAPLRNSFRPLIVPDTNTIRVQIEKSGQLYGDGDHITDFDKSTQFTIANADQPVQILRRPLHFYTRLKTKLLRC
jgi:NAD+ kinase